MDHKQELNFDSELLKPIKELIEETIDRLLEKVFYKDKKAEIVVKIGLDKEKKVDIINNRCEEWLEPRITCKITEKVKEYKETNEYTLGFNYELKDDDGVFVVEKINQQISLLEK